MVASQQQASYNAMTNVNGSQNAHTFLTLSMAREAMSQIPPAFPTSNGSKRMAHAQNSRNVSWTQNGLKSFTKLISSLIFSGILRSSMLRR